MSAGSPLSRPPRGFEPPDFDAHQAALMARMKSVVDAQHAVAHGQLGAGYALRPTSEALADEPPPPPLSS